MTIHHSNVIAGFYLPTVRVQSYTVGSYVAVTSRS
eukprot:COSAG01_NODE_49131_length_375_cov_0.445652_1_plen_34_part_10